MRKALIFLFVLMAASASGQMKWNAQYQHYIDQYKDVAIEQMHRWGVPASITLAQGVLESGAGRSLLTRQGNNHFGIKCHGWTGGTFYQDDDQRNECFRTYPSAYDSFEDHSRFLANGSRYKPLFKLKITDYKGWARGLKEAGYATNPKYASHLIELIQLYKLYNYDVAGNPYDKFIVKHTKSHTELQHPAHIIKKYNNNYYTVARSGDTFRLLGDEFGISYKKLAKYNERDRDDVIEGGETVWLKKKMKKAPADYEGRLHYVRAGDSMYSIAQKYGIQLKALYKLNRLRADYQLRVGDQLRLR